MQAPWNTETLISWTTPRQVTPPWRPDFADDESLKQAFGILLAKGKNTFDAGMELFNEELQKALWVSVNWAADPIVEASKDIYLQTLKKAEKPLDKEQLLAKVMAFADERILTKDGVAVPLVEAKVRLDALKLYSEISGFTGRVVVDASTNINSNNTTNNLMKIVLVKAENKEQQPKLIEASNTESKIHNQELPPIALKLVGGSSR